MKQKNMQYSYTIRLVAMVTALFFLITSVTWAGSPVITKAAPETAAIQLIPDKIKLPVEMGEIQETYLSKTPFVILIEDAHAIPDAQRNIRNIIQYFQRTYGIKTIAVEGASAGLDAQIFRSFPDKERLEATLEEYLSKGELTGSAAAAILSEMPDDYRGIEDWHLYEAGLALYLQAMEREIDLSEKLQASSSKLQAEKEKNYSKELLEVDGIFDQFRKNEMDLVAVLKKFEQIKKRTVGRSLPVPISVQALLDEIEKEGKAPADIESEVKSIAEEIKKVSDTAAFNEKYQAFQTSQISAVEFAVYLKEFADRGTSKVLLPVPFSPSLLHLIENHKTLRDIEGTNFFKEFERYAQAVKESLFENDAQRQLDQESRKLYLLGKLTKLELNREEWEEIKAYSVGRTRHRKDFDLNIKFYKNAEERDAVFFTNLIELIERRGQTHPFISLKSRVSDTVSDTAALLVAGGFHTEGLTERFKDAGISYAIVRPRINKIPEHSRYRAHMRGDVSWKDYFRVEDGKINLYEAFVRGLRDRLLREAFNASRDTLHAFRLLKAWRDQIIRDLAEKEEIIKAGQYTSILDEVTEDSSPKTQVILLNKVDRFLEGLHKLESEKRLTEQNILGLLKPATIAERFVNPGNIQPGAAVFAGDGKEIAELLMSTFGRSELRTEDEPKEDSFVKIHPLDEYYFNAAVERKSMQNLRRLVTKFNKKAREYLKFRKRKRPWVLHINSSVTGGVGDILTSLNSVAKDIGLNSKWFLMEGDPDFYHMTKTMHNIFHGNDRLKISNEEYRHYEQITKKNAERLIRLIQKEKLPSPAIIVLHDQQPLGMISELKKIYPRTKFIWRGHIPYEVSHHEDASSYQLWHYLTSNYINRADAAIFHIPDYKPGFNLRDDIKIKFILPSINPASLINRYYPPEFIQATLAKYGIPLDLHRHSYRPLVMQNGRFDHWKDQLGVVEAYERAVMELLDRDDVPLAKIPRLVFIGPMASDDPEGQKILQSLKQYIENNHLEKRIADKVRPKFGEKAAEEINIFIQPFIPDQTVLTPEQLGQLDTLKKAIWNARMRLKQPAPHSWEDVDIEKEISSSERHEIEVGAFLGAVRLSGGITLTKSIREGFALAATSNGWHETARIASYIGGLPSQIINESQQPGSGTGFLVGLDLSKGKFTREKSIEDAKESMIQLMLDDKLRTEMAVRAKEHVGKHFLPDRHLRDYLELFLDLLSDDKQGHKSSRSELRLKPSASSTAPDVQPSVGRSELRSNPFDLNTFQFILESLGSFKTGLDKELSSYLPFDIHSGGKAFLKELFDLADINPESYLLFSKSGTSGLKDDTSVIPNGILFEGYSKDGSENNEPALYFLDFYGFFYGRRDDTVSPWVSQARRVAPLLFQGHKNLAESLEIVREGFDGWHARKLDGDELDKETGYQGKFEILSIISTTQGWSRFDYFPPTHGNSLDFQKSLWGMRDKIRGQRVGEIGSGSGVNALWSAVFGAKSYHGTEPSLVSWMLANWNIQLARDTQSIPDIPIEILHQAGLPSGEADVYLANIPAVVSDEYPMPASYRRSLAMRMNNFRAIMDEIKKRSSEFGWALIRVLGYMNSDGPLVLGGFTQADWDSFEFNHNLELTSGARFLHREGFNWTSLPESKSGIYLIHGGKAMSIPGSYRLPEAYDERSEVRVEADLDQKAAEVTGWVLKAGEDENAVRQQIRQYLEKIGQHPWKDWIQFVALHSSIVGEEDDLNLEKPYSMVSVVVESLDFVSRYLSRKRQFEREIQMRRHALNLQAILNEYRFKSLLDRRLLFTAIKGLRYERDPSAGVTLHYLNSKVSEYRNAVYAFAEDMAGGDPSFRQAVEDAVNKMIQTSSPVLETDPVRMLFNALGRLSKLKQLDAPEQIIRNQRMQVLEKLEGFISPRALLKFYGHHLNQLPESEYHPLLGRDLPYRRWAEQIIASGKGGSFMDSLTSADFTTWDPIKKFDAFYRVLNLPERVALAQELFARLNSGQIPEDFSGYLSEKYDALIAILPRHVGVLTEPKVTFKFYMNRAKAWERAAWDYRQTYDQSVKSRDEMDGAEEIKQNARENLSQFFIYNPSPELLKRAFQHWSEQRSPGAPERKGRKGAMKAGTKINLISDRELNALRWIVNNIPKSGTSRDARRRLHDFVLSVIGRRIQREDDPVAKFMAAVFTHIKTDLTDRGAISATVLSFLDFAVIYSYMPRIFQKNKLKSFQGKLEKFSKKAKGAALYLTSKHYDELKAEVISLLLKAVFEKTVILTKKEVAFIKKSIADHPDAWFEDNLMLSLARYYSFQDESGQKAVEQYLLLLARADIEGGRFKNIPRYQWPQESIQAWFGEKLTRLIQQGYKKSFSMTLGGMHSLAERYTDIGTDLLTHMEIRNIPSANRKEALRNRFIQAKKEENFEKFWDLLKGMQEAMHKGEPLGPDRIEEWKQAMTALGHGVFPYWSEVLIDFDHLTAIQRVRTEKEVTAEFGVTEDAVEFIRSGEKPCYTCQRIIEPTGQNRQGRPVNRARQGHFILGQIQIDGRPEARSILEIAKEKREDKKVLLVERFYTSGLIPNTVFQREILDWVDQTGEIDYVAFASSSSPENGITSTIDLELLPLDGEIYRDTVWPQQVTAVDMAKYREKRQAPLPSVDQVRSGITSSSRSEIRRPISDIHRSDIQKHLEEAILQASGGQISKKQLSKLRMNTSRIAQIIEAAKKSNILLTEQSFQRSLQFLGNRDVITRLMENLKKEYEFETQKPETKRDITGTKAASSAKPHNIQGTLKMQARTALTLSRPYATHKPTQKHHQRMVDEIEELAKSAPTGLPVLVLGAGALNSIPLSTLISDKFPYIVLVDIYGDGTKEALEKKGLTALVGPDKKIRLIDADVSGVSEEFYQAIDQAINQSAEASEAFENLAAVFQQFLGNGRVTTRQIPESIAAQAGNAGFGLVISEMLENNLAPMLTEAVMDRMISKFGQRVPYDEYAALEQAKAKYFPARDQLNLEALLLASHAHLIRELLNSKGLAYFATQVAVIDTMDLDELKDNGMIWQEGADAQNRNLSLSWIVESLNKIRAAQKEPESVQDLRVFMKDLGKKQHGVRAVQWYIPELLHSDPQSLWHKNFDLRPEGLWAWEHVIGDPTEIFLIESLTLRHPKRSEMRTHAEFNGKSGQRPYSRYKTIETARAEVRSFTDREAEALELRMNAGQFSDEELVAHFISLISKENDFIRRLQLIWVALGDPWPEAKRNSKIDQYMQRRFKWDDELSWYTSGHGLQTGVIQRYLEQWLEIYANPILLARESDRLFDEGKGIQISPLMFERTNQTGEVVIRFYIRDKRLEYQVVLAKEGYEKAISAIRYRFAFPWLWWREDSQRLNDDSKSMISFYPGNPDRIRFLDFQSGLSISLKMDIDQSYFEAQYIPFDAIEAASRAEVRLNLLDSSTAPDVHPSVAHSELRKGETEQDKFIAEATEFAKERFPGMDPARMGWVQIKDFSAWLKRRDYSKLSVYARVILEYQSILESFFDLSGKQDQKGLYAIKQAIESSPKALTQMDLGMTRLRNIIEQLDGLDQTTRDTVFKGLPVALYNQAKGHFDLMAGKVVDKYRDIIDGLVQRGEIDKSTAEARKKNIDAHVRYATNPVLTTLYLAESQKGLVLKKNALGEFEFPESVMIGGETPEEAAKRTFKGVDLSEMVPVDMIHDSARKIEIEGYGLGTVYTQSVVTTGKLNENLPTEFEAFSRQALKKMMDDGKFNYLTEAQQGILERFLQGIITRLPEIYADQHSLDPVIAEATQDYHRQLLREGKPQPTFAPDAMIEVIDDQGEPVELLFIVRADGKYATVGGFGSQEESAAQAMVRELDEETDHSLDIKSIEGILRIGIDPGRDKRSHIISPVFLVRAQAKEQGILRAGDDAKGGLVTVPFAADMSTSDRVAKINQFLEANRSKFHADHAEHLEAYLKKFNDQQQKGHAVSRADVRASVLDPTKVEGMIRELESKGAFEGYLSSDDGFYISARRIENHLLTIEVEIEGDVTRPILTRKITMHLREWAQFWEKKFEALSIDSEMPRAAFLYQGDDHKEVILPKITDQLVIDLEAFKKRQAEINGEVNDHKIAEYLFRKARNESAQALTYGNLVEALKMKLSYRIPGKQKHTLAGGIWGYYKAPNIKIDLKGADINPPEIVIEIKTPGRLQEEPSGLGSPPKPMAALDLYHTAINMTQNIFPQYDVKEITTQEDTTLGERFLNVKLRLGLWKEVHPQESSLWDQYLDGMSDEIESREPDETKNRLMRKIEQGIQMAEEGALDFPSIIPTETSDSSVDLGSKPEMKLPPASAGENPVAVSFERLERSIKIVLSLVKEDGPGHASLEHLRILLAQSSPDLPQDIQTDIRDEIQGEVLLKETSLLREIDPNHRQDYQSAFDVIDAFLFPHSESRRSEVRVLTEDEIKGDSHLKGEHAAMQELADVVLAERALQAAEAERVAGFVRSEVRRMGLTDFAKTFRNTAMEMVQEKSAGVDEWTAKAVKYLTERWSKQLREENHGEETFIVGLYLNDEDGPLTVEGFVKSLLKEGMPGGLKHLIATGENIKAIQPFQKEMKTANLTLTTVGNPDHINGLGTYVPILSKTSRSVSRNAEIVNVGVDAKGVNIQAWNPVLGVGESGSQVTLALTLLRRIPDLTKVSRAEIRTVLKGISNQLFPEQGKSELLKWDIQDNPQGGLQLSVNISRSGFMNYVAQLAGQLKARAEIRKAA